MNPSPLRRNPPALAGALTAEEQPGTIIGRYRLLEKIGEGGFGAVYVAEQREPVRRRVALKVIKLGMDTRQVVARFEAERQALAMMDHPNIAKVLDAGATDSGRPYFVMELVKGVAITTYCDQNNLPTQERLELFIQTCQAIQHAHQKGVIHRDIKPSNILVTVHDANSIPVPKVIDFGIAKATQAGLTDKTVYTHSQQFIGTPAYVSPEQAEMSGLDVDTRSDIYSLGVLLYELLIGKTPFDTKELLQAGLDAMRHAIREKEPLRPSLRLSNMPQEEQTTTARRRAAEVPRLMSQLRGDLDWIVMKCLEKDRTRRYETANGLAADLKRHLQNEPVIARPSSATYRFKKAWRRHRLFFLASSAMALTLLLAAVVSSWQAIRAQRQRRQALESEDRALGLLYASDMREVQQAIEGGRLPLASKLLKAHLPRPDQRDRRGFEWFYYNHVAKGQQSSVLLEQPKPINGLTLAPDGKMLALLDQEEIKVFDLERRQIVHRWPIPHSRLRGRAISPDGRWIALGITNGFELLNTTTGQTTVIGTARCEVMTFAAERPWIAVGRLFSPHDSEPSKVEIWDYEQRRLVCSFPNGSGPLLWWETNSTILAGINYAGILQRWNAVTGTEIQKVAIDPSRKDNSQIAGAVASRASRGVLFAIARNLSVFDPTDGRVIAESAWPFAPRLALSADGRLVASAEDTRIRLATTDNLQKYERLAGHTEEVSGVAFIGLSSNFVSCAGDGRLLLWEPKPRFLIPFVPSTNQTEFIGLLIPRSIFLSSDQRFCSVYGKLWSLPSGQPVQNLSGTFVAFSPTGTQYATANSSQLQVWKCEDPSTNPASVFSLPPHEREFFLSLSPDGRFGALITTNLNLLVFQARTGRLLADSSRQTPANPNGSSIIEAEFLPTSQRLLVTMDGPEGAIWDWQTRTNSAWIPLPGHFPSASPDGRWIASLDDTRRNLKLVTTDAPQKTQPLLEGENEFTSVASSHDGQTLASVDSHARLSLWRLPEGRRMGIISLELSEHDVVLLAFSADDQSLYIAAGQGMQVLEAPRTEPTALHPSLDKLHPAALPPDSVWSR